MVSIPTLLKKASDPFVIFKNFQKNLSLKPGDKNFFWKCGDKWKRCKRYTIPSFTEKKKPIHSPHTEKEQTRNLFSSKGQLYIHNYVKPIEFLRLKIFYWK